ncbi:hypothetical protein HPB50_016641 [Hyalomma asiaticum]|uniref:Uncharacterized protein n=1 Tax=Hyalomma asiaticum TaxID=266040 RepID=A0ACB7SF52_HYAAI|nr:hypothetical protein HPB50_016641 [Hyalomma asiaticum]
MDVLPKLFACRAARSLAVVDLVATISGCVMAVDPELPSLIANVVRMCPVVCVQLRNGAGWDDAVRPRLVPSLGVGRTGPGVLALREEGRPASRALVDESCCGSLLHTAGATTTDADSRLLRELFLQRLPVNVRTILASAADKRLSELAELADSVLAVAPPSVAALQPDIASRAPTTALHDIREQISRLADTVAAMQARSTPEERQRPAAQQKTCWYHRKYGNAARKCIPPCDHAGNGSGRH